MPTLNEPPRQSAPPPAPIALPHLVYQPLTVSTGSTSPVTLELFAELLYAPGHVIRIDGITQA